MFLPFGGGILKDLSTHNAVEAWLRREIMLLSSNNSPTEQRTAKRLQKKQFNLHDGSVRAKIVTWSLLSNNIICML